MEEHKSKTLINHMMKYSLDMICTIDSDGRFIQVSQACNQILGYTSEELAGQFVKEFLHSSDGNQSFITAQFTKPGVVATNFENTYLKKNGQPIPLNWSAVWSEVDNSFFCIARDTTVQKAAVKEIVKRKELHHLLVAHGSDMHALLEENGNYLYAAGTALKKMGYQPEQLIGVNILHLLHPEDIPKAQEALILIQQTQEPITLADIRFKTADRQWCWVETTFSNQLQNPAIQALFVNFRDITQRKQAQLQLTESEQRFRSLFENNPDIVLYQNEAGTILDANQAFLSFMKVSKEAVINCPLSDFLPAEVVALFQQKLQEAFSGIKVSFEVEINCGHFGPKVLSIVKVPLTIGDKVVAVHAVMKDITAVILAHRTIEQQTQKLNTIVESISDAFFTLDKNWKFTRINCEFDRILGTNRQKLIGENLWSAFPEEITQKLYQPYHQAAETGKTIHLEIFFETFRKWFEIRVYPSEEGLSVYFHDITEKVNAKKELEKLSLVARKTTNSVIITDACGITEWVNEGFTNMTGYTLAEITGKNPGELLEGPDTDKAEAARMHEKLKEGVPFNVMLIISRKSGESFWVSIDFSPVFNEQGNLTQYIAIQKDITFRKEAEANLLKMSQDLYEHNRDLKQFTYIVSHNLRAPVANAMGLINILTMVDKEPKIFATSLKNLQTTVGQLDAMLKDLNLILSIRDNQDTVQKEPFSLAEVSREAVAHLQEPLAECQGEVTLDFDGTCRLITKKAYLYSIFYNLLSNAIKYRSPARRLQIKFSCRGCQESKTIISIADNGLGMDLNKVGPDVFKLYKRFHRQVEGRGMGLFLVKTHVEVLGGRIEVRSQVDVGTEFIIYLPSLKRLETVN